MITYRSFKVSESHGITLIVLLGPRLDEVNDEELGHELNHLIEAGGRKKLVLDLSSVHFISSAGLGRLIATRERVMTGGGKMRLCGIRVNLLEVFAVTNLDHLFSIDENQAVGMAALGWEPRKPRH
jgi:anti-sigma B factor antagonist